ncbi:MAG: NAD(P)H-dependent oxidoreductase subunit E, partial [Anaerolineales bacterium]|nr:NAD(P)H-dependent oxidoreductase subunit E [Anaerolineales bacterium]
MSHGTIDFKAIAVQEAKVDLSRLQPYLDQVASRGRTALLPTLHHAQSLYGWLPREVQEAISYALRIPQADIHGVIEFYTMFYAEPTAQRVIRVCEDPACSLHDGEAVIHAFEEKLGLVHGETTSDRSITFEHVPCLGMCELAPAALDGEKPVAQLTTADVTAVLEGSYPEPDLLVYGRPSLITERINKVDPLSLDDYKAQGGYEMLTQVVEQSPEKLIETVESF